MSYWIKSIAISVLKLLRDYHRTVLSHVNNENYKYTCLFSYILVWAKNIHRRGETFPMDIWQIHFAHPCVSHT